MVIFLCLTLVPALSIDTEEGSTIEWGPVDGDLLAAELKSLQLYGTDSEIIAKIEIGKFL
jgi:hypothetical protein